MTKLVELKPFDRSAAEDVWSCLFCHTERDTEDGLEQIPSASYQLVVSALESMLWETRGHDREVIRQAQGIVEQLRDKQKIREWTYRGKED